MSQREKTIAVILISVAILWGMTSWSRTASFKKPGAQTDETHNNPVSLLHSEESQSQELKRILEQLELRSRPQMQTQEITDPFRKFDQKELLDKTVLEFSELVLSGVMMENSQPIALINDQILKEGDKISGFEVKEIRPNEVVLIRGLEKYTLKLFTEP